MDFKNDPKFSFIIPVYDVPLDVFKRCLMSIADQDYSNIEVVIVPNGGDEKAEALAREFSHARDGWKIVPTKEKGACNARNLGFKESTGEIVSFFNSDYIAKEGMVRMWVDNLLKYPDCGFVYGAYEYSTAQREVYWSKAFDVYQLKVANFIDCGFPVWRKHVKEWDVNCKSLQDWDFWLTVIEKGIKGHFMGREISFVAAPPRQKGLSHDSSDNWIERVSYIKKKHGIPERDICVTSVGAPNHGIEIAKMLGADYRDDTLHKPHNYKALYLIGWYMKPGESSNAHSGIIRRFPKSKKIVHFVGADIYWLRKFSIEKIRQWAGSMKLAVDHVLCENELAQKELKDFGIDAEIVPIPPYTDLEVKPLPKDFTVAIYLTDRSDFDKYLQKETLSIVKAMPNVKFLGYGDAQLEGFKAKNFEHRGTLKRDEWEKFVYECSAYLRIVRHDTRPMASDEFIMAGRSVITNIPNPYMSRVNTSGDLPFDAWDTFSPGFNPFRWPATKKKIIQAIRAAQRSDFHSSVDTVLSDPLYPRSTADIRSDKFKRILDKEKYRETINRLAQPKVVQLEVANA